MESLIRHPIELSSTKPSEQMGQEIMSLRYDLMLEVLRGMCKEAARQHKRDQLRGKKKKALVMSDLRAGLHHNAMTAELLVTLCSHQIQAEKAHPMSQH